MAKEYIERNEAIKELRDVYEQENPTASGPFDEYATMLVPRVLKKLPTADVIDRPKWISVAERLPKDGELVMTYSTSRKDVGHCSCLKSYVERYGNYDEVTHWMPLPELPEGGANE